MTKRYAMPLALMVSAFALAVPATAHAESKVYRWQTFNNWDVNRSGFIEGPEYQDYAFTVADVDGDGRLEQNEFVTYTRTFYDPMDMDYDQVTYYDADGDGFIERKEFRKLSAIEGERTLYRMWDYDRDNLVGPDDWTRVTTYYTTHQEPRPAQPPEYYND